MISIQQHCSRVRDLFGVADLEQYMLFNEWLLLASSIEDIHLDISKYDDTWGLCESAHEYDLVRERVLNKFTKDLTIFSFIWCAIESLVDKLNPPPHPDKSKRGKIRNISYYLNTNLRESSLPAEYINSVSFFKNLSENFLNQERIKSKLKSNSEGIAGIGLLLVYEFRNSFAHGSMLPAQPNEEHEPTSLQIDLVQTASRICLLTIQLIFLSSYEKLIQDFEQDIYVNGNYEHGFSPLEFAYRLHLDDLTIETLQLNLLPKA